MYLSKLSEFVVIIAAWSNKSLYMQRAILKSYTPLLINLTDYRCHKSISYHGFFCIIRDNKTISTHNIKIILYKHMQNGCLTILCHHRIKPLFLKNEVANHSINSVLRIDLIWLQNYKAMKVVNIIFIACHCNPLLSLLFVSILWYGYECHDCL